ncbi:MAG TPA: ATPase [Nitrospiraceae bacterium]|nr:ATPase [Nitrospiraceae bacterium]HAS53658.1 ATPase [Nitrospiraceae bacterium]
MRELTREGWNGSFDKLAGLLTEGNGQTRVIAEPGKQEVVITRVFDAPRDIVFKAYTDPNRIPQWWGPKRFTTAIDKMDVRRGGIWRFIQHDAEGREYAFHGVYHEVRSPVRLVQTFEFEGTPGQVSLETATFEEQNGRTRVTNRSVFQSVEDRDEMLKEGMEEGVTETMDRLAEVVAKAGIGKKAA